MSKLTKTQVTHMQARLNSAIQEKVKVLFPQPNLPRGAEHHKKRQALIDERCVVLHSHFKLDLDKYPNTKQYLNNLAYYLTDVDYSAANKIKWKQEDKDAYVKLHQDKINDILDIAILGDSEEALAALKSFKEAL